MEWNDGMADTLRAMADRRGADDGEFSVLSVALAAAAEIERLKEELHRTNQAHKAECVLRLALQEKLDALREWARCAEAEIERLKTKMTERKQNCGRWQEGKRYG